MTFKITQCDCHLTFASEGEKYLHGLKHEPFLPNDTVLCSLCNGQYAGSRSLRHHIEQKHIGIELKCYKCDKIYYSKVGYKDHINSHLQNNATEHICTLCDFITVSKKDLKTHIRLQHNHSSIKCKFCDHLTLEGSRMKTHVKIAHVGLRNVPKSFKCQECPSRFTTNEFRTKHFKENHKDTKYQCNVCEYYTPVKRYLIKHTELHNQNEDANCNYCQKMFKNKKLQNYFKINNPNFPRGKL